MSGELGGGFVGFAPGDRVVDVVEVAWGDGSEAVGEVGADGAVEFRADVLGDFDLVLDGFDDALVAVAGVDAGHLTHEIEVFGSRVVSKVGAVGGRDRGDGRAGGVPVVENWLIVVL